MAWAAGPAGPDSGIEEETTRQILEEAGKFAKDILLPLDPIGDREGVVRDAAGAVTTAPGWKEAWRQFAAGGWTGLSAPEPFGGQGLTAMLQAAVEEIWNGANAAFAACSA